MQWVLGFAVILAIVVTVVLVGRMRKLRLQRKVRLEITNAGNVKSRYNLRAQDPESALEFQFTLDGDSLALHGASPLAQVAKSTGRKADRKSRVAAPVKKGLAKTGQVLEIGGAVAGVLGMIGSLLPGSVGRPLQRRASDIRNVQMRASYMQQTPERVSFQASSVARTITGKKGDAPMRPGRVIHEEELQAQEQRAAAEAGSDGFTWAQTPYVEPGKTLAIELLVRSLFPSISQAYTFQVISHTADGDVASPAVTIDGSVHMRGGIWTQGLLPYVLVGVVLAALLVSLVLLGYWLLGTGLLA